MKKKDTGPGYGINPGAAGKIDNSKEMYHAFYQNAPLSVQSLDSNGIILDVNSKWCEVLGYNHDEVVGKWFGDFLHDDHIEIFRKRFEDFKTSGSVESANFSLRKGDGSYIEIDLSGTIGYSSDGEMLQTFCIFSDYSHQKEIENELEWNTRLLDEIGEVTRTTEQKYQHYLELSPAPIFITNKESEYIYVNIAACKLLGYTKEELLQMSIPDLHYRDYSDAVKGDFETLQSRDILIEYQTVIKTKSNINKSVMVNTVQLPDWKCIAFITDISSIRGTELALSEREATITGIFKVAPIGIWLSVNRVFVHVNPAICKILGYEKEELLGNDSIIIYQTKEEYDRVGRLIDEQFESGTQDIIETVYITKQGIQRDVQVNIIPLDTSNREKGFVFTALDITDKKDSERSIIRAMEKAEESDRLKSAFLQNMSHEIRTPMNGIVGFIELLRIGGADDPNRDEYFDTITKCSNQLINIVNDILDISKIETGQVMLSISKVNVGTVLNDLKKRFFPLAKIAGLNFSVDTSEVLNSLVIDTDEEKLIRIFNNLISNGLKFTEKGSVKIGCKKSEGFIRFYVSDTGMGIGSDENDLVFKRFRQADDTTTRKMGGAGLGLAISKGLVELLGGSISFESEAGKGTTFTFSVPYIEEKKILEKGIYAPGKDNCGTTILVVEDSEFNRYYLKELLSMQNYNLMFTENGEDAIEICKTSPEVDIVLLDIKLPGIDGLEAARVIKEHRPDLIIIAQTAYAMDGDRVIAINAGCNDYIAKPIDAEKLLKMIKSYS